MALITTLGAIDADSYATVAQADAYHEAQGNATWTGDATAKEQALRRATAWIDATYRMRWPGRRRLGRLQALEWPRYEAYDVEGEPIDSETIPPEVIKATCEAALREIVTPGSMTPDLVAASMVKSEKVGSIAVEYVGASSVDALRTTVTIIGDILSGIVADSRSGATGFLARA